MTQSVDVFLLLGSKIPYLEMKSQIKQCLIKTGKLDWKISAVVE